MGPHNASGSTTHPCPTVVHMGGLLHSGPQSLHSNICSYHQRCLTQAYAKRFVTSPDAVLFADATYFRLWLGIGHPLKRHPLSRLVHSANTYALPTLHHSEPLQSPTSVRLRDFCSSTPRTLCTVCRDLLGRTICCEIPTPESHVKSVAAAVASGSHIRRLNPSQLLSQPPVARLLTND